MFMTKLAILYGVLLIAAAEAFPGMIPNHARQDTPISDTQPIRLSSVSGAATSSVLAHTPSPSLPADQSTIATPTVSLSTNNRPSAAERNLAVSTPRPDTATMTLGVPATMRPQDAATASPSRVAYLPPRGLFMTA